MNKAQKAQAALEAYKRTWKETDEAAQGTAEFAEKLRAERAAWDALEEARKDAEREKED